MVIHYIRALGGAEANCKYYAWHSSTSRDWYFGDTTVKTAIALTKELMAKYNISLDHVVRHYDVTGKICPNPYVYNHTQHTWEAFKAALVETQVKNCDIVLYLWVFTCLI